MSLDCTQLYIIKLLSTLTLNLKLKTKLFYNSEIKQCSVLKPFHQYWRKSASAVAPDYISYFRTQSKIILRMHSCPDIGIICCSNYNTGNTRSILVLRGVLWDLVLQLWI